MSICRFYRLSIENVILFSAVNCTAPPVQVDSTGLAVMNWTEETGNPRPYNTFIQVR